MPLNTPSAIWIAPALAAALLAGTAAHAQDTASGADIRAAVSGKTFQGSMTSDRFAEYYAEDGSIRADGYSGTWQAKDGKMCFTYGTDPESCWEVGINGPAVTLYKDGAVDGVGMLVDGNPYGF